MSPTPHSDVPCMQNALPLSPHLVPFWLSAASLDVTFLDDPVPLATPLATRPYSTLLSIQCGTHLLFTRSFHAECPWVPRRENDIPGRGHLPTHTHNYIIFQVKRAGQNGVRPREVQGQWRDSSREGAEHGGLHGLLKRPQEIQEGFQEWGNNT